ncbi:MAG: HEPN domain-containing protein [Gemmataceae bacterium]|nr:HEPN domain-containing protein [Gemmataceae bacterium]
MTPTSLGPRLTRKERPSPNSTASPRRGTQRPKPVEAVCFHAQQCVEKYLKAILVYRSIPFPKSHNIRVLMALVPRRSRPALPSGNGAIGE